MKRTFNAVYGVAVLALAACSSAAPTVPTTLGLLPGAQPAAAIPMLPSNAPPRIVRILVSALDIRRGAAWRGTILTSSNVASVEVRSSLFSINARHVGVGRFAFDVNVLDLPPIFIRAYAVRVIARNTPGAQAEEDFPFRIR